MAVLDADGRVTEINDALGNWLERSRAGLLGCDFWEELEKALPGSRETVAKSGQNTTPFARYALRSTPTGSEQSLWFMLETARGAVGSFVRMNSVLPPLTELEEGVWDEHLHSESARREMFMRLLRAEARLDRLLRRWPCVVFSQRPDFGLQFASPNIQELTGISVADWSSQPRRFWELVHEQDAVELRQQFKRAVETRANVTSTYRIRHALTGRVTHILEQREPVISQNKLLLGYEVVWLDVTRQTVAEKRLSTAAWKETLAILTLGMAHDFRNIMAGIHSLSESYLLQMEGSHPFKEGLSLIQKNSGQANQLVQRMINLHLGQVGERSYHDLNEVVRDIMDLVAKILPRRIRVGSELAAGTLPIYADLVELRQAIINLLLNAADAMPQGGHLTLKTSRHVELPKLENMKGSAPRLPCVCLTIQDTGTGIKERHLAAIFDPFFTTKAKGSGLGLYNARVAVEKHSGAISVESKEGAGTSFHLWLPQADLSESAPRPAEPGWDGRTRRTLLLLGQTGEVLDKTAEWLRLHNYYVVLATTPESVPELLQSGDYQFAGVLVLAEPRDAMAGAFLQVVRQQGRGLKMALKLAGCSPDELGRELLDGADLLLNSDLPETDILLKLETFLK
ncbi:MAG TPA: ATP-binding protein [Verrucomicrobiae bacterium]|nr:ATP-binding protein [Verrucomicrobiae bacterium]